MLIMALLHKGLPVTIGYHSCEGTNCLQNQMCIYGHVKCIMQQMNLINFYV